MKILVLIAGMFFMGQVLYGQSLERQVIGNVGLAIQNGNAGISFTVGEVATASGITNNGKLTQGFQQAEEEEFVGVIEVKDLTASAVVFPNPSKDVLQIKSTLPSLGINDLTYEVVDLQGRSVFNGEVGSDGGKIQISGIAKATYILLLKSSDGSFVQRIRFTKI